MSKYKDQIYRRGNQLKKNKTMTEKYFVLLYTKERI